MPDYHRPKVAAALLEISERKLKQWMRSGRVAVSKVDGCVWVDVDSGRALIASGRRESVLRAVGASPDRRATSARQADYERALAFFASPSATASPHKPRRRA